MADPNRPFVPPVPRDHADASFSEMVPISSKKINLLKSPFFLFILLTAIITPYTYSIFMRIYGPTGTMQERIQSFVWLGLTATFFISVVVLFLVYLYVRPRRSIWIYFIPFVIVAAMVYFPQSLGAFIYVFRTLLPGDVESLMATMQQTGRPPTFTQMFVAMLFGAGLMEELLKATPILIGAFLSAMALRNPAGANNPFYNALHVQGPLDGALMGIFAGGAFVVIETGLMYVPNQLLPALQGQQDIGVAMSQAYALLFPRVFGGLVGHMAYSGVFGYFIGLSVIRPRQRWTLLLIGYGVATLLHTLWNSVGIININLQYVISIATALALAAAVLKARQLEASRGMAAVETGGSIVVERPRAAPVMPMAPALAPAIAPAMAPAPQPVAAPAPPPHVASPPAASPPAAAPPAAAPPPQAASAPATDVLMLNIDGMMLPLRAGGKLDLAAEPALGGRGAGIIGAIIPHPTRPNVLGLKNEGAVGWQAKLRDGSQQTIAHDQSIRLAAGVEITFVDGLNGAVVKVG